MKQFFNKKIKTVAKSQRLGLIGSKPTILIIFGATGDLAVRKLLPALFHLFQKNLLPPKFKIIAWSRRPFKDADYYAFIKNALREKKIFLEPKALAKFLKYIQYHQGLFDTPDSYKDLKKSLVKIDQYEWKECSNKLFHLAVPSDFYEEILKNISHFGLAISCSDGAGWPDSPSFSVGWTRILIEKPFGKDTATAEKLDKLLGKLFREEQIFRIDHYLAKETLQNITLFRFSNVLFEPIWNNKYIEKVEIKLFESLDIQGRGNFYDNIGALRDVGQNHMLRMLALIAMENPKSPDVKSVWQERTKILHALQSIPFSNIAKHAVRGQYNGYRKEPNVKPNSTTETYFKIKTFINNKRWQGVPFYLESGKVMKEKKSEIVVYLKKSVSFFCPVDQTCDYQNTVTFAIQPEEGISVCFWAKKPGLTSHLEPKNLSFSYIHDRKEKQAVDDYGRILFDCIRGDQTFFTGTEEVKASWEFITPIINAWQKIPLHIYKKGSDGPNIKIP